MNIPDADDDGGSAKDQMRGLIERIEGDLEELRSLVEQMD